MASGDILVYYGAEVTGLAHNLDSLPDGDAAVSAAITDASPSVDELLVQMTISTNQSTAPDDDTPINFFIARKMNSVYDGSVSPGVEATDAEVELLERCCEPVKNVTVLGDGLAEVYVCSFIVEKPGVDCVIITVNHTGQTFHSSGNDLVYQARNYQVQS